MTVGGFIITGDSPKQVVLRAIGPSLAAAGVTGAMANPKLDLHDSTGSVIASNDDWKPSSKLPPTLVPRDRGESILTVTLPPGAYSAVLQGASSDTGIALFELYDIDTAHSRRSEHFNSGAHWDWRCRDDWRIHGGRAELAGSRIE